MRVLKKRFSFFLNEIDRSIVMSYQIDDRMRFQAKPLIGNTAGLGVNSKNNTFTADDYIYRARLAEKALRYEDMLIQMRNVLDLKKKLTADERNLLVVAYKNAVTTRRTGVCVFYVINKFYSLLAIRHLATYCKKLDEAKFSQVKKNLKIKNEKEKS
jgi:hypothetical protein